MQRLDRYVLGSFLRHWFVVATAFVALFTMLDLVGHSDEIAEAKQAYGSVAAITLRYYLWNAPFLLVQFAPYVTLLAALSTVMQLLRNREWTPMLTAGRSAWRAFLPMLVAAAGLGFLLSGVREVGFRQLQVERAQLQHQLFEQEDWRPTELWVRGPRDERLQVRAIEPFGDQADPRPRLVGLEMFSLGPRGEDVSLRADAARWDGQSWILSGGRRTVAGDQAREEGVDRLEQAGLAPKDFLRAWFGQHQPLELTAFDARELLARDPGHRQAATLGWSLSAAPWVHVVLLLLGLPFVLSFERRTSLEGVAVGLLLCAFFFVADFLFQDLGQRGVLSPWLAGTGPVLLFGALGIWGQDRLAT